ncbi:hypothetical protein QSH57_014187 [Fusarium oxysporum f. sp. vasinfectum]|nr:hypothetical protein QSH57_014187 [Fusarium oxysporum f. sp. vasinfectum]
MEKAEGRPDLKVTRFFRELPFSGVRRVTSKDPATLESYNTIATWPSLALWTPAISVQRRGVPSRSGTYNKIEPRVAAFCPYSAGPMLKASSLLLLSCTIDVFTESLLQSEEDSAQPGTTARSDYDRARYY